MRPEAEYDYRSFENRTSEDSKVWVRFFMNPVEDQVETEKQGRPIFVDKEYVEIRSPGNETNVVCRPASALDKQRFPRHYAAFKQGQAEAVIGTPLSEVPWIKRSQVEEFKYLKILTVEHLASVNDDICGRIPGLTSLKNRAIQFLEDASKPKVDELLARIAALEAQINGTEEE